MKKILICLLLFFSIVFAVNAEEIKSFQSDIKINKDGTIDVKETITYDFGDLYRHGIYRNIPYIKTNQDGKKLQLDFSSFSVTDENNLSYRYSRSTINNNIQLKIGDSNMTVTGVHSYVISYRVGGALTYFSDHDELYWNVTGNEWDVPINYVNSEITLPYFSSKVEKNNDSSRLTRTISYTCYTGIIGSRESQCNFYHDRDKVRINSISSLNAGEGLTVVVGFPKNIVAVLEPKEFISFWNTFIGKLVGLVIGLLALIWYVFLPFSIIYKWFKTGRDPKGTVGITTAWYDPPKTSDGKRFFTPGEVGTLGDETVDLKDISATIVDLARRGYLRIEERKKGDFFLVRRSLDEGGSLLSFEQLLLNKFFKTESEIRLKNEHLYEEVEEIKKSLYEQTVTAGLFPKNPQSVRTVYYVIAGIALFTFNFFLAIVAFIFGRVMPRKTVEGVNAKNVAFSLRNFLTSQERQLKFQAETDLTAGRQVMFERLLPYAVAFGVEKVWAKRFETMNIREPDWYQSYSSGPFNSWIFVSSLSSSMSSFRTAATPTRSSSGFSSGFSGGFSGGGGGGGGGGSW
ncbi:DUF2207 domain-containing protein [Candidatus Gracilibacteria bacterium]|nr:DUF2207 domain-containing protein [Candidatus Gracilibacteria bacterium]